MLVGVRVRVEEFVGVAVGIKDEFVGVTVKVDVTDTVCVLVLVGVGVLGLLEDPLVEFQPAELAVEVVRHRWWIAQKGSKIEPIVGKAFRCFGLSHGGKFGVW